jgi:hypothetical protein
MPDLTNVPTSELNKPITDRMTPEEAVKYGGQIQRYNAAVLASLYEFRRQREIEVISRMAVIADKTARYGRELPADQRSPDYVLTAVLDILAQKEPISLETLSQGIPAAPCSLEYALRGSSRLAVDEVMRIAGVGEAARRVTQLAGKYPNASLDPDVMSPADRSEFLTVFPVAQKGRALVDLSAHLYRLAHVESTSKKMLLASRQDQYQAPGDGNYIGTTWNKWLKDGTVTETEQRMSAVLALINQHLPDGLSDPSKK